MKVYRVVPDIFVTDRKLDSASLHRGLEGIYYQAGYTSFTGKMEYHRYNTLIKDISEEGKYFFLFAEDTFLYGDSIINCYHRLRTDKFLVIEYDIPEEIIVKIIGIGDYTSDISKAYGIESYVTKRDFGNSIIDASQVSIEEKIKFLVQSLDDSLQSILECRLERDMLDYLEYFNVDKLDSVINDKEKIQKIILNSPFYNAFISEKRELIKSAYITGKIIPVSMRYLSQRFQDFDEISEYYQSFGVVCDFSEEQLEYKNELIYYLQRDNQDKEKIKTLLQQKSNRSVK